MFALEITFQDGTASPETVLVQRPYAIVGASDYAHVVIGDLVDLPYELHMFRGVGRTFRTVPVPRNKSLKIDLPDTLQGQHADTASFNLGPVLLSIVALDIDLVPGNAEPPDRSAVRILRRAVTSPRPGFPAVAVGGEHPLAVSFSPDQPLVIGRDKQCALRLEASDVSGEHARITFEGGQFFLEDLGSTNGTFIAGQQVSGKTQITAGQPIVIGRSTVVYALDREESAEFRKSVAERDLEELPEERYPMLVSLSEVARPPRLILQEGMTVRVGREPSSDLWLGAPHVSRKHCTIEYADEGDVVLTDLSMNGLAYDGGVLSQSESIQLGERPTVLNFGGGITVALCHSPQDEEIFNQQGGHPTSFLSDEAGTYDSHRAISQSHSKMRALKKSAFASLVLFFKRLTLGHRIALMFTIFLVLLATSLVLKLIIPLLF